MADDPEDVNMEDFEEDDDSALVRKYPSHMGKDKITIVRDGQKKTI